MRKRLCARFILGLAAATLVSGAATAAETEFSVLHTFDVANATTGDSPGGSQPDTRPMLGPDNTVYGMTYTGGANGTGVIYKYGLSTHKYSVIHTFGALDANMDNEDGAYPGVALTRGPDDVFYGMASFGGTNGNGTVFSVTPEGKFKVLHEFSALDANLHNEDGANPLRTIVVASDGNLYGTTRTGGENGLGVAWVIGRSGGFIVVHQFTSTEGHAASLLQARDGYFYGCAVFPNPTLGSGILYRMDPSGHHFEVLYRFTPINKNGANEDGANCYEPLVERHPGVFYGTTRSGGNGNGVVFRYSLAQPNRVAVIHNFSVCETSGATCINTDGASPESRLTLRGDSALYGTASNGGTGGSGVVFRVRPDEAFEVLHTFSAVNATTGANKDGALPDFGVIFAGDDDLIGMADAGGKGDASYGFGNGTLYRLSIERRER
ncbi:MAG TPA: choice-of-anchor tandem repeat GloVer-containing protein [Steroidobacteraceae bacterium]|nr:choice-of-anchor tandem repeat GloVer-containing protein [Steroidobacteraceae bacterium]